MKTLKAVPEINPKSAWLIQGNGVETTDKLYKLGKEKQMKRNI